MMMDDNMTDVAHAQKIQQDTGCLALRTGEWFLLFNSMSLHTRAHTQHAYTVKGCWDDNAKSTGTRYSIAMQAKAVMIKTGRTILSCR